MRISMFGRSLLSIGPDDARPFTAGTLVAEAKAAEEDGLSGYWIPQQFDIDAMTAVGHIAQHVRRIDIGVGVLPMYERHPLLTAQQTLTADVVTGGRFTLGLGLGHRFVVEGFWGGRFERPVPRMREYLAVLLALVRTGRVEFHGEFFRCASELARLEPRPSASVLLGALGPRMLGLAGEVADGTITWMCGPRTLRDHVVPLIGRAAQEAERPAPRIVAALPVCVTEDASAARERIAVELSPYAAIPSHAAALEREGAADCGAVALVGRAGEVLGQIAALWDIGVTELAAVLYSAHEGEREATREALRTAAREFARTPVPTVSPTASG